MKLTKQFFRLRAQNEAVSLTNTSSLEKACREVSLAKKAETHGNLSKLEGTTEPELQDIETLPAQFSRTHHLNIDLLCTS